ncbi:MAG: 3-hydroxyacyl-ACP dehydratase FabZ [Alphaproteobacteria bacterium]
MEEKVLKEIRIDEIVELLPHRYPFLLVDRVSVIREGEEGIGIKNVSMNEPFFPGHFPHHPVMPGVLIVEAMGQAAAVLVMSSFPKGVKKLVYFMGIESAKFRKPVRPGDQLIMHISREKGRGNVFRFRGEATVDGNLHAEALFTAMIFDEK